MFYIVEEKVVKRLPLLGPEYGIAYRDKAMSIRFERDDWAPKTLLLAPTKFRRFTFSECFFQAVECLFRYLVRARRGCVASVAVLEFSSTSTRATLIPANLAVDLFHGTFTRLSSASLFDCLIPFREMAGTIPAMTQLISSCSEARFPRASDDRSVTNTPSCFRRCRISCRCRSSPA
jgi:hypothetical protein